MKVALVNPPFSRIVYGQETRLKSITPCLGLFYLEAYCRDLAEFAIFEGEFYDTMDDLMRAIAQFKPDVLGVTTNTSTYPLCRKLAQCIEAKTRIVGGPYSSFRVDEALEDFDVAFIGDSEHSMRSLLLGVPWVEIPGIAFKNGTGGITRTSPNRLVALDD